MRRLILVGVAALGLVGVLGGSASANTRPPFPESKLDLVSAMSTATSLDLMDLVAAASSSGGGISGTGSPPRIGPEVRVNEAQAIAPAGLVGRSETTITVDDENMLAGWNDAEGFCGPPFGTPATCPANPSPPTGLSGWGYSTDGGATWIDGDAPTVFNGIITRGDPWMDDNGEGTFYYANLAVNASGASLGASVHRGHFAGGGFVWDGAVAFDSPNNPGNCTPAGTPCDFYDKEALAAGRGSDDVYVSLTNFLGQPNIGPPPGCGTLAQFGFGQIEVWRSHDGGVTFQGPAVAGPEAPDSVATCGNAGTLQQSSNPAVAPNGDVYVVWQFGPTFAATGASSADADIVFAKSTDGGATFTAPAKIVDINSSRANPPIGYNRSRINDHPRVEVAQTGKHKGRVYVTYYSSASPVPSTGNPPTAQTLVDIQVFVTHSDDGGTTWSTPVAAAPPIQKPANVGAIKRYWPDVSIGPGGDVHVVYLEERATQLTPAPADVECTRTIDGPPGVVTARVGIYSSVGDQWWTYSRDGGVTWSMPLKLGHTTTWCGPAGNVGSNIRPNTGDYIDAEAYGGNRVVGFYPASGLATNGTTLVTDSYTTVGKG
jgi:hypothetical protein